MKRFGLLGAHLGHSYSPQLHALLGGYPYELFEVAPEDLDSFLRAAPFDGCNVTIPYKQAVLPYCAELSDTARRIGSVNTLLRRADGSLYGDNTDYGGFLHLLERCGGIAPGERAMILGSGGASKTAAAVLEDCGVSTVVISRTGEHRYEALEDFSDTAVLVNATPVGMYPANGISPVSLDRLPRCRLVLDLVYNPAKTALLLDAERRGLAFANGLPMLVEQAALASERFTGKQVAAAVRKSVLCKLSAEMRNIILIGMPGCGKTMIGRALAADTGRRFLDADEELEKRLGCNIPRYFSEHAESEFRQEETKLLAELGKQSGCVIATGGGCVTVPQNRALLRQNGTVIWLKRPLSMLAIEGRPISLSTPVEALYARRAPLYAAFSDGGAENNSDIQTAVAAVKEICL